LSSVGIGKTNDGGNQIAVGEPLTVALELDRQAFTIWNQPGHFTTPFCRSCLPIEDHSREFTASEASHADNDRTPPRTPARLAAWGPSGHLQPPRGTLGPGTGAACPGSARTPFVLPPWPGLRRENSSPIRARPFVRGLPSAAAGLRRTTGESGRPNPGPAAEDG